MEQAEHGLNDKQYAIGKLYDMKLLNVYQFRLLHVKYTDIKLPDRRNTYILQGMLAVGVEQPIVCTLRFPYNPFFPYRGEQAILHPIQRYGGIGYKRAGALIDQYFYKLPRGRA